jgi:hypothetical protein
VKLQSASIKRTGFAQNFNSESVQLAEFLPNSDSDRYSSAANSGKHVQLSDDSASGQITAKQLSLLKSRSFFSKYRHFGLPSVCSGKAR